MWNVAFSQGGQACTIPQFEELTGVLVDHYVVVNFGGFKDMVDAIDGVPVCIPEDIVDPAHGIYIAAGDNRVLRDAEALNYVRARYALGDGSDISRIKRQQAFIASMVNKRGVQGHAHPRRQDRRLPQRRHQVAHRRPRARERREARQARPQLQDIGLDKIQFLTIPNAYYPVDSEFSGRVYWTDEAERRVVQDRQRPATEPPPHDRVHQRRRAHGLGAAVRAGERLRGRVGEPERHGVTQRDPVADGRGGRGGRRDGCPERPVRVSEPSDSDLPAASLPTTSLSGYAASGWPRCSATCSPTPPRTSATRREPAGGAGSDAWLRAQVPPHHG